MAERKSATASKKLIADAEKRISDRVAELDQAAADGQLWEAIKDVPPIREQIKPTVNHSASA